MFLTLSYFPVCDWGRGQSPACLAPSGTPDFWGGNESSTQWEVGQA